MTRQIDAVAVGAGIQQWVFAEKDVGAAPHWRAKRAPRASGGEIRPKN